MLTTQTNIALQIVDTLSPEELAAFAKEFAKRQKPVAISKPKKIKPKSIIPTHQECMNRIMEKYGIQAQGKLA